MPILNINLAGDSWKFAPGERIEGEASWQLDGALTALEIRLVWKTSGKGSIDTGHAATTRIERPPQSGRQPFSFVLPFGPYTFSGKLISLSWAVEIESVPAGSSRQLPFLLAPGKTEIVLPGVAK